MSSGHLVVVGASFKTAPLEVRERLAIGVAATPDALRYLHEYAEEVLIVSTCNRIELYLATSDVDQALYGAMGLFRAHSECPTGDSPNEWEDTVYTLQDGAAAQHLIEVAAGADSLVLGEHEILAQLRQAIDIARETRTLGPVLSRLCQCALRAGKRARTETAIGRHAASVSLAAVRLAQESFGSVLGRTALVVGAGKTAGLVAQALKSQKCGRIAIASRRLSQAEELARRIDGGALDMIALPGLLPAADLVISCTSAPEVVLTAAEIGSAQRQRGNLPLMLIDLAVPRDIDPAARAIPGVTLYDMDDLQAICERNQAARRAALGQVEAIIQEEAAGFLTWWQERRAVPSLALLRAWAEDIRQTELQKTLRRLSPLSKEEQQALEALTEALVNKLLHHPTMYLKAGDGTRSSQVVHDVFGVAAVETPAHPEGVGLTMSG